MGKATVLAHLGGAKYSVTINQDETRLDDLIQAAQDMLGLLDPDELAAAQADYDQAIADYLAALAERDDDINLAIPGVPVPEHLARQINEKTDEISEWFDTVAKAEFRLNNIKARILQLEKRIEWLQSLYGIDPLPATAYCIDLSDGNDGRPTLAADVGTIEPFHRGDEIWLINGNTPSFRSSPTYAQSTDGSIVPVAAMTPAQFLYNYAMWSGLNAWRPKYHVGVVTAKAAPFGPMDVEIVEPEHLSRDNFSRTHSGIPAQYMDCDARAFLVGDRVVVAYDANNTNPRVVGFAQAPRECPLAKDFLVQDLSDASYWRLSPDANGDWTLTASSKIAGPCVWMGRANKLVSCHYLDHKVYENGTGYTLPTVTNNGQSSVDPIYPFQAGYNSSGDLICIGGFFKFLYTVGPLEIPRYQFQISCFRYSAGSWIRDIDIWNDGSESDYSGYVTVTEAGYWRAELSSGGDKVLIMPCSDTSTNTWHRYVYTLDHTAKTATQTGDITTPNIPFGVSTARTEQFIPDEEWGGGFDYTRVKWHLQTAGYTEEITIGTTFSADGEIIELKAEARIDNLDWYTQDDLGSYTGYIKADASWTPDLWGASVMGSAITMDVTSSDSSVFKTVGPYGLGAANISAFSHWSRVAIVTFENDLWPGEAGHLAATNGTNADAVEGCTVVANGQVVVNVGSNSLASQTSELTFGWMREYNPSPPVGKIVGDTRSISPQTPVPIVAPPGWTNDNTSLGSPSSWTVGPEGYMYAGADMAGNVVVLDRHTVSGSRVQYISNDTVANVFTGFTLDGLRLVGMI